MLAFDLPDILALGWFLGCWIVYSVVIEKTAKGRSSLNARMNAYRAQWMTSCWRATCAWSTRR